MARLILLLAIAAAVGVLAPSVALAASDAPIAGQLDSSSMAAGAPFTLQGWLVDTSAASGSGVDAIDVSLQPKQATQAPIDLGQARLAQARPDVAVALNNPGFATAGYAVDAPALPAGTYTVSIDAHIVSGAWIKRASMLDVGERWTQYGFNIAAPAEMWPMLELLHRKGFDWELASASQRPTRLVWADLPAGVYGQYVRSENVVNVSNALKSSSVELRTAFVAHELTHLTDDLNGRLGDMSGNRCYEAETRAFVNEANFWQMLWGPQGKPSAEATEAQENAKMFAFVGNSQFADLVVHTTPSYIRECGIDQGQ